jgi:hypothetical protein
MSVAEQQELKLAKYIAGGVHFGSDRGLSRERI